MYNVLEQRSKRLTSRDRKLISVSLCRSTCKINKQSQQLTMERQVIKQYYDSKKKKRKKKILFFSTLGTHPLLH